MTEAPVTTPTATAVMADTPAPAPAVTTSAARAADTAELAKLQSDPAVRERLLKGDGALANRIAQLQRSVTTPTGLFIAGEQSATEVDQIMAARANYIGATPADIYGEELGGRIETEIRTNAPISGAEFRMAKSAIEEMKHDAEFQQKLRAGNVRAKARWSLAHNMITRPIADTK